MKGNSDYGHSSRYKNSLHFIDQKFEVRWAVLKESLGMLVPTVS